VIGVHTPEFAFEKNLDNVRNAVKELNIQYPVAVDNNDVIWRAFANHYWPAHYFIDVQGNIRHHQYGESGKEQSERVIQQLLAGAGKGAASGGLVTVNSSGAEAAPDGKDIQSFETYVGYQRTDLDDFVSPGGMIKDKLHIYRAGEPDQNDWGVAGDWTIGSEHAVLNRPGGQMRLDRCESLFWSWISRSKSRRCSSFLTGGRNLLWL
jgi:hypothetical protein